jgi:glycosyltransferase involved in cell wall biosynthesis
MSDHRKPDFSGSSAGGDPGRPVLSIGIPTFNRAKLLRVALEAIFPQTEPYRGQVEVLISDNASDDDTKTVIDDFEGEFSFRRFRNTSNLGPVRNMLKLATEYATGAFVWLLGDDDLLTPGAVGIVLESLRNNPDLDSFYLNFRCAQFDDHWPESAVGGYDGAFDRYANADLRNRRVEHWHELIRAESWMGTQVYVHVVRRTVWQEYFHDRAVGETYSHPRWTWPHTVMIAETLADAPSLYVGHPVLTIFDQSQSWLDYMTQINVSRTPELMSLFSRIGVDQEEIRNHREYVLRSCRPALTGSLRDGPAAPVLAEFMRSNWRSFFAWRVAGSAYAQARPRSALGRIVNAYRRVRYGSKAAVER